MEGIPPTFAQRPQTKSAEVGTSAELECRFVAIPEAEVQWFHNKNLLPPNDARVSIMHQVRHKLHVKFTTNQKLGIPDGHWKFCRLKDRLCRDQPKR